MKLFHFEWPSLARELRKWQDAKTGHENKPPLHELEARAPRAVPAELTMTGIDRERLRQEIDEI